ncbi:hypothetical protein [Burkholderia stabilis]|uniref:hypothetical protein n=1 Tax=Burkholderia stabilis TaxID=95485 RepID=UPI0012FE1831|nr:hypothetical protein [Burkholderia stabilis]
MRNRAAAAMPAERAVARRIVSRGHDAFHYFRESVALDIFLRITHDITNQFKIYRLFITLLKDRQSSFIHSAKTLKTPYFTGLPRSFPYQTFPYPADIPSN